jgi:hypothetical protein
VEQLGVVAEGEGGTDYAANIQGAIGAGFKSFYVPKKTLAYVISTLSVGPGDSFYSNGAELIQPVVANFTRMFTTFSTGYTGTVDSDPFVLEGFILNGNRANQGAYLGFEKEQSALVFLSAGATFGAGRIRSIIRNCIFKECTADGISVHRQVDIEVSGCEFDNCFRGSLTLTGGGSEVRADNLKGHGTVHPSAHQIEVDSSGFDGNRSSKLYMANSQFAGGFDVAVQLSVGESDATSDWFYSNCEFGTEDAQPFNVNANDMGVLRAVNCTFGVGTDSSRIFRPGDSSFNHCKFLFNSAANVPDFIQPGTDDGISTFSGQRVRFIDCDLEYDSSFAAGATVEINTISNSGNKVIVNTLTPHGLSVGDFVEIANVDQPEYNGAFYVFNSAGPNDFQYLVAKSYGAATETGGTAALRKSTFGWSHSADDSAVNKNKTIVSGGSISPLANYGVYLQQGGAFQIESCSIDAACAYFMSTSGSRVYDVELDQNHLGNSCNMYAIITASVDNGETIRNNNVYVPERQSTIWTTANMNFINTTGRRIIQGTTPSNAANNSSASLAGDEWKISPAAAASPYSYVATTSALTTLTASWLLESSLP